MIFYTSGNKGGFEPLLESMQNLAENVSDPVSQRAAFTFLSRCVSIWGQVESAHAEPNGNAMAQPRGVPGFERFVYERLVPAAFGVLSSPQFNLKDGQMLVVRVKYVHVLSLAITYLITSAGSAGDFQLSSSSR